MNSRSEEIRSGIPAKEAPFRNLVSFQSVGPFIGPGHAGIVSTAGTNWLSCHFYDGTRAGTSTLAILPLQWTTNDWPEVLTLSDKPTF
ncbi:MAG TPA: hypothetical protein VEC99_19140 [Clostridia bacterium]|nr:hypothetical protein [Clostridia bacterium]